MRKLLALVFLPGFCLCACSNDPYQGVYEGIKNQNESKKTPQEREINPTPSYDAYKKERSQQSGN